MYTKLFNSLVYSSIWSEDSDTCKVWVTLLAIMDREGCFFGSALGLARICNLPIDSVESALDKFLATDPRSADLQRNPEGQGRRIIKIDGGWAILNATYYRDLKDQEQRRKENREYQRKYRQKKREESL